MYIKEEKLKDVVKTETFSLSTQVQQKNCLLLQSGSQKESLAENVTDSCDNNH